MDYVDLGGFFLVWAGVWKLHKKAGFVILSFYVILTCLTFIPSFLITTYCITTLFLLFSLVFCVLPICVIFCLRDVV